MLGLLSSGSFMAKHVFRPVCLAIIEKSICPFYELFDRILGANQPPANRDRREYHLVAIRRKRDLRHIVNASICKPYQSFILHIADDRQKLVAAPAPKGVSRTQCPSKHFRNFSQCTITICVTKQVVDGFQLVQVSCKHPKG